MEDHIHSRLAEKRYEEAFELLLGEYQNKVFRLAWSMLRDRAQAEDAAQEIFIRIWKALPGYRREAALSTWIYAIARNTCITALKSRRPALSIDEPEVRLAAEARHASRQERESAVDLPLLLSQLPDKHRQAVMLYFMEDQSYEEVASMLDLPMGTVKSYLHRGRKKLAEILMRSTMGALI